MAQEEPFVDYYEALQVSPTADAETVERVFRHLAKRLHPDNAHTGDRDRFDLLMRAFNTLKDAGLRAAYDVRYHQHQAAQRDLAREARGTDGYEHDRFLRSRLLSLLYVQRRRDPKRPGLGDLDLCRQLDCPFEHVSFHLWYLRQKRWVEITETGLLAITADGVDQVEQDRLNVRMDHLLTERGGPDAPAGEGSPRQIPEAKGRAR